MRTKTATVPVEFDAVLQGRDVLVRLDRHVEYETDSRGHSLVIDDEDYENVAVHFYDAPEPLKLIPALDLDGEQRVLLEEVIDGYLVDHPAQNEIERGEIYDAFDI